MPITINGTGTVTGLSVGGLPDGCVDSDTLASGVGGKILQVKSTKSTAVDWSTNGESMVEYAPINTTITPSSTSNKILILVSLSLGTGGSNGNFGMSLYDGSSAISDSINSNVTTNTSVSFFIASTVIVKQLNFNYLWSPNTTSEKTVKVYLMGDGASKTLYVNRYGASAGRGGQSSMTLMEVAG